MKPNRFFRAALRRARALLAAALVLAVAAGCGSSGASDDEAAPASTAMELTAQDVATAQQSSLSTGVVITGTLDPYKVVNMKAQAAGTVAGIRVDAGDAVRAGQRMAAIQAQGLRSQVAQAKSAVASAKAQLAVARKKKTSAKALYEAGALSQIEYKSAQAAFEAAQSQLAAAQSQLTSAREQAGHTVINAPLTGKVSERSIENGEAVNPGSPLFTVVNTSQLELQGQVPVDQTSGLKAGQPVTFTLDAYPGRTFRGKVNRIEPTADPESRQLGLYLRLPNRNHQLVGGLFATGRIERQTLTQALVVPADAVHTRGDSTFVYAIRRGRIRRRPVRVAGRNEKEGRVAIASGLSAGDRVLTAASTAQITVGDSVRLAAASSSHAPDSLAAVQP